MYIRLCWKWEDSGGNGPWVGDTPQNRKKLEQEAEQRFVRYGISNWTIEQTGASELTWKVFTDIDQMQQFYQKVLPKIQATGKECGYAIAVHGSMRRDLDLIAVPWVSEYKSPDTLAHQIQLVASGISEPVQRQWEHKPNGRIATSFPICIFEGNYTTPGLGHVDLSVVIGPNSDQYIVDSIADNYHKSIDG